MRGLPSRKPCDCSPNFSDLSDLLPKLPSLNMRLLPPFRSLVADGLLGAHTHTNRIRSLFPGLQLLGRVLPVTDIGYVLVRSKYQALTSRASREYFHALHKIRTEGSRGLRDMLRH